MKARTDKMLSLIRIWI